MDTFIKSTNNKITIYTDGASKSNPGPAGGGIIIKRGGKTIFKGCEYYGTKTNNEAEYLAFIRALEIARGMGLKEFTMFSDSKLVVCQVGGEWKVKSENIKKLCMRAQKLMSNFNVNVEHVLRHLNTEADALANESLEGWI
jgi:ribonuclease HI